MQYKIEGGSLPIVEVSLENGETIITQGGGMVWMSPNLNMETSGGGVGKMFSKMMSGESIMQNRYTAMGGPGFITLASSFPGSIIPFEIQPNMPIIVQKSGFLASSATVDLSLYILIKKRVQAFLEAKDSYFKSYRVTELLLLRLTATASSITLHPVSRLLLIQATLLQWMHLVKWTSSVLRVLRICSSAERVCLIQLLQDRAECSYSRTRFQPLRLQFVLLLQQTKLIAT